MLGKGGLREIFESIATIVTSEQVLSSIWKASIKTLIKLLSYKDVAASGLDADRFVRSLAEAPIDPIDRSEEEQKLLLKQKALIKAAKTFNLSTEARELVFKYVLSAVKRQTVDDLDHYYSL